MTVTIDPTRNGTSFTDVSAWRTLPIQSGDYLSTATMSSAISTFTASLNTVYFAPVLVTKNMTFTGLAFSTVVVTAASYKVAVYQTDSNQMPTGLPITGTSATLGPFTTAAATQQTSTFGSAITLPPGLYYIAILPDTSGTVGATSANNTTWMTGTADVSVNTGRRFSFALAYASGLGDATGIVVTYTTSGLLVAGLKVQ